jgi:energy-coupling factor transport system ATP-binding protein
MNTPVLVFDEPTAGLDHGELAGLGQAITWLHQHGKTAMLISHDLDFLAENVERLVLMRQGKVVLDASAAEFFGQKGLLEHAGLVPPQMVRLSQSLGQPEPGLTVEEVLGNLGQEQSIR